MESNNNATRFIHTGKEIEPHFAAVVPAVYRATSFHQQDPWNPPPYDYSRSGNPTRQALEDAIALLEGGVRGLAFSSGMSAITTAFLLFQAGDHILVTRDCQGGTQRVLRGLFQQWGLDATYVDTDNLDDLARETRANTKAVFIENFSNPFLRVTDIAQVAEWAKSVNLLTIVDNTFVTPYLQKPLAFGADVVLHSASKMIAGHSDVTAGVMAIQHETLAKRLYFIQNACGLALSPDDSYQVFRGLKTLPARMEKAQANAMLLAQALSQMPEVAPIYFPGLSSHPGHDIAQRTMAGFGTMLTFRLKDGDAVRGMVERLRFIVIGAGFGGAETSISLPELHCHAALTSQERQLRQITPDVVRVSVGLENGDDLVEEFRRAIQSAS